MTTRITFVENKPGIDHLLKSPTGDVGMYMRRGAMKVQAAARMQAGSDTGRLKSSISIKQERTAIGQKVMIGSDLGYAHLHHEGSRPHIITAKDGGVLRFTRGTRVVYDRAVRHPGTRANRFLSDNLPIFFTTRR